MLKFHVMNFELSLVRRKSYNANNRNMVKNEASLDYGKDPLHLPALLA